MFCWMFRIMNLLICFLSAAFSDMFVWIFCPFSYFLLLSAASGCFSWVLFFIILLMHKYSYIAIPEDNACLKGLIIPTPLHAMQLFSYSVVMGTRNSCFCSNIFWYFKFSKDFLNLQRFVLLDNVGLLSPDWHLIEAFLHVSFYVFWLSFMHYFIMF